MNMKGQLFLDFNSKKMSFYKMSVLQPNRPLTMNEQSGRENMLIRCIQWKRGAQTYALRIFYRSPMAGSLAKLGSNRFDTHRL